MSEPKITIAQALALFETDPQAGYREAISVLHEELIRLNKLNQSLTFELAWAWDNLKGTEPPAADDAEYDFCLVCSNPEWNHKSECELKPRREHALKLIKGENSASQEAQ